MSRTDLGVVDHVRLLFRRPLSSFGRRRRRRDVVERAVRHLSHRAGLGRRPIEWLPSPAALERWLDDRDDLESDFATAARIDVLRIEITTRQWERATEAYQSVVSDALVERLRPERIDELDHPGHRDLEWTLVSNLVERLTPRLLLRHREDLAAFTTAASQSACWVHAGGRCAIVDRPVRNRRTPRWLRDQLPDSRHLIWADGTDSVAWADRMVDGSRLWDPQIDDIVGEPNLFVRQIMLERHGVEAFFAGAGARLIHSDLCGRLYDIPAAGEPLRLVRVINSTPEPDGSFAEYILRVPPWTRRAREAVAWTFGLDELEYAPAVET
jgi:hypothetical protein